MTSLEYMTKNCIECDVNRLNKNTVFYRFSVLKSIERESEEYSDCRFL